MKLSIVGIGPGHPEGMTREAHLALEKAEVIVGYTRYVDLVRDAYPHASFYATGMRGETERAEYAVSCAESGRDTAIVCSGDAGVYGMASLVLETAERHGISCQDIRVIPGVTAALSGAALLGAPFSCDFAVVSLSDLLVDWAQIERRLRGAAEGGFPIALYNPGAQGRTDHLKQACRIIRQYRSGSTPCAVVENIGREGESVRLMTLDELADFSAGMLMTILIGEERTYVTGDGRMITPRGYERKYARPAQEDPDREKQNTTSSGVVSSGAPQILLFGGTTEGRELAETAVQAGYRVTVSVATGYGSEVLNDERFCNNVGGAVRILTGPMPEAEMRRQMGTGDFCHVIDATHPYAAHVTRSIRTAAEAAGTPYCRVRRDIHRCPDRWEHILYMNTMEEIILYLNEQDGAVFFATGSGMAEQYASLRDFDERAFVRILPSEDALKKCRRAGFRGSRILCMQGPFGQEMNEACFRHTNARFLVTKMSGHAGGFEEKLRAAENCGMQVLVLLPPEEDTGESFEAVKRDLLERRFGSWM